MNVNSNMDHVNFSPIVSCQSITHLKEGTLRSQILEISNEEVPSNITEFLLAESVCAIALSKSSRESIWLMKIISERVAESKIEDDYKHVVQKGDTYIEGRHLEEDGTTRSELKFKLMKKVVFFRKESVVYPFINFQRKDDTYLFVFLLVFFYTNHPLQGFRSHCSVRGYSSLLVATAGAEATTRTGRQHTRTHSTPNSTLYYLQT